MKQATPTNGAGDTPTASEQTDVIPSATRSDAPEPTASATPHEVNMAASAGGADVIDKFALPPHYAAGIAGVKKKLTVVQVGKPKRTVWWISRPDYVLAAGILFDETSTGKDAYLVQPALVPALGDDVVRVTLHGVLTRQGVFIVVPVRMPGPDGRIDTWNESMREAIATSYDCPVRTASNRDAGAYDVYTAPTSIPMPPWPDESWGKLLAIAFRGKCIEDAEHPVLRRLRGEA